MSSNRAIAAALLAAAALGLAAQDAAEARAPAAAAEAGPASLAESLLPLEIATSTYYELVAHAKRLGLAQTGDADDLRARLYAHYGTEPPGAAEKAKGRSVVIDRASAASYGAADETGDLVRASGGVVLTLTEENGDSHRIEAGEIVYDRARNAVTAGGGVTYTRSAEGVTEIFSGQSLTADLDDWSGVFLDGKIRKTTSAATAGPSAAGPSAAGGSKAGGTASSAASATAERGLVLSAETMLKRSADVMVFENGVITSCDDEDPHFAVRAGKVWLLGVREWAVQNALFSLGNVPILWLPAFYYPGDELVFHPVFGYRTREGRYVQTTTYLLGRKPRSTASTGILKIADDGKDGPTELKGLFLRRVSGNAPDQSGPTLKAMADAYSGLGVAAALQGAFPKAGPFSNLSFYAGLGVSRTLFATSGGYSPFAASGGWKSDWNETSVLGLEVPLRYSFDLAAALKLGPLSASLSLPIASDPFFDRDFRNRSEDMDWIKALSNAADTSTAPGEKTALTQKVDLSMSFQPKVLSPYVGSIDLTRIGTSMVWAAKARTPALNSADPARSFLFPSSYKILDFAASLRGTALRIPFSSSAASRAAKPEPAAAAQAEEAAPRAEPLPAAIGPWASADDGAGEAAAGAAKPTTAKGGSAGAPAGDQLMFRLPARAADAPSSFAGAAASAAKGGLTASVDWSVQPSGYIEDRFLSDGWTEPSKIDLADLQYSMGNYRVAAALDSKGSYGGDLVTGSLGLSFADQAQGRWYQYDPTGANAVANDKTDAAYKSRSLKASTKLSSRPFTGIPLLASTSFSWSMDSTLYGYKYDSKASTATSPVYAVTSIFDSWDASSVTAHNAAVTVTAKPGGLAQSLVLTASLPPLTESYAAKLALDAGPADLSLQSRVYRPAGGSFSFDPLTATLVLGASPGPVLNDSFVLDLAKGLPQSNVASFAWGSFSSSLTARRAKSYEPVKNKGWVEYGDERLTFTDLGMSVKSDWKSPADGKVSWSLAPGFSLSQNLLRFSESNMTFSLSSSVKAPGVGSLTFSLQSQNTSAWRYYSFLFPVIKQLTSEDMWRNPFEDLFKSLEVWNYDSLTYTLWKLKSLSLKATRDLHDWDLSFELGIKPVLKDSVYRLDTTISALLAWKDITEIKSQVKYDSEGISGTSGKLTY